MMSVETKPKKRKLSFQQKILLQAWIVSNKALCLSITLPEIASKATEALGFRVPAGSVSDPKFRELCGLPVHHRRPREKVEGPKARTWPGRDSRVDLIIRLLIQKHPEDRNILEQIMQN